MELLTIGQQAQNASYLLAQASTSEKNQLLHEMACEIVNQTSSILAANQKDVTAAQKNGMSPTMLDRLTLTIERIKEMANGIKQIASLQDPIGTVDKMWKNEQELLIGKQRVPLGVIGIIYESRPNVTTDAACLCFKSGNAVILKGGKEAFYSNQALVLALRKVLERSSFSPDLVQFVEDTSRETTKELMCLNDYLDVLIPRGGAGLIKAVVEQATVPVIETGTGNCHIYVDKDAQMEMARDILINAKCQRPSVCNAAETLLIHKEVAAEFLPIFEEALAEYQVEIHADETALTYLKHALPATELDFKVEFLDYTLAIKVVNSIEEAIQHIQRYGTKHSEAIISDNYFATQLFLQQVDAAAVYANASTRFTDGFMFGFGAEIGISTQKLHARGPMGLEALTSTKYIIYGNGQIRP